MKFKIILILFSVYACAFSGSKKENYTDIAQIKTEVKTNVERFKNSYLNKDVKLVGRMVSSFKEKDGIMVASISGLDAKLEAPYVIWTVKKKEAKKYDYLRHRDIIYLKATITNYSNNLIYLDDVKIKDHEKGGVGKEWKKLDAGKVIPSKLIFIEGCTNDGTRSESSIAEVILGKNKELEIVYNKELRSNETIGGSIRIQFEILPNGVTENCQTIFNTLNNEKIEKNIFKVINTYHFSNDDKCKDKMIVQYTFAFINYEKQNKAM